MQKTEPIRILKVRFDKITLEEATKRVFHWTTKGKKRFVTTPNPEILLVAQKNHKFLKILNHSDLNIADGTGVLWAAKYLDSTKNTTSKIKKIGKWFLSLAKMPFYSFSNKKILPERVTGSDLMLNICKKGSKKIFLLGAAEGVGEIVREKLEKINPQINIVETHAGSPSIEEENKIIEKINSAEPEILFVAYGAPNQEIWIDRNIKHLHTVKVAIGVGGSFDFIAKIKRRAPKWLQNIGMEWIFRLIQQPTRFKRIYNATVKFPITILKKNLKE